MLSSISSADINKEKETVHETVFKGLNQSLSTVSSFLLFNSVSQPRKYSVRFLLQENLSLQRCI